MDENKTYAVKIGEHPAPVKGASLMLIDARRSPMMVPLGTKVLLGRERANSPADLKVVSEITSSRHGEFFYEEETDSYYYVNYSDVNGTYINGRHYLSKGGQNPEAYRLADGDVLRVDRKTLNEPHPQAVLMVFSRNFTENERWQSSDLNSSAQLTIGRAQSNIIRIKDMTASREHAVIARIPEGLAIYDKNSQNGVYVNAQKINGSAMLYNHDVIRIASTILIVLDNLILYNNPGESGGALSVNIRNVLVDNGRRALLRDVAFTVDSNDFVLILGGSGAGKTTLINAILGKINSDSDILLDGQDLKQDPTYMHAMIGLVPQFIDLRLNDKVYNTLRDLADIKLDSRYYDKQEKDQRVYDVMEKVGISALKDHYLRQLSGGQKKKTSVAAQLIGFQRVFICDEPDSGLDAASREQQMSIFKGITEHIGEMANSSKIVMVISHEPDDAINPNTHKTLFTKVLVIAKSTKDGSGHLAFFGTPQAALRYFNVERLQDIMKEINPQHEGGKGLADYYIERQYREGGHHVQ